MAALAASVPSWIPEDDLLLKNAVEAGASLEALAKGAVRFSRKFTVRELRERWHSLLYDADVSAEASARMVELELLSAKFGNNGGGKVGGGNEGNSGKRKVESVRRLYYAMRKKSRSRNSEGFDIGFLGTLDGDECFGFGGPGEGSCDFGERDDRSHFDFGELRVDIPEFDPGNVEKGDGCLVAHGLVNFENCAGVDTMTMPCETTSSPSCHEGRIVSPLQRVPLWKTIEDVSAPEMPMDECIENKDCCVESSMTIDVVNGDGISLSGEKAECKDTDIDNSVNVILESDFPDLSDTLLIFANEDEQSFMNTDGQDILDTSCHDEAKLLLANAPNNELPEVMELETSVATTCSTKPEVVIEDSKMVADNNGPCPQSNAGLAPESSISVPNSLSAEQSGGEMECLLNTEDTEIPCNDDVGFSKSLSYAMQTASKRADYPSYYFNRKDNKYELVSVKKEDNSMQSVNSSRMLPVNTPNHQFNGGVMNESAGISPGAVSGQIGNPHLNSSHFGSHQPTPSSTTVGVYKADLLHACNTMNAPSQIGMSSPREGNLVPEAEPSGSNEEQSSSEDDDVPSFSDIEAMILEMDLCPEDSSSLANSEVLRYQNEEMKKSIIRLEQCARSSMQRAIASRGAIAVLYGRHLKHYIRDTEVILGRATDDVDVDIDLGREGPANKISRRQALIKLGGDGSFFLKNLGKGPMYVNGTELVTGQRMNLGSSSLIEIRGMAFVFEMDDKSVRRYLGNIAKPPRQSSAKFEWSDVRDKG